MKKIEQLRTILEHQHPDFVFQFEYLSDGTPFSLIWTAESGDECSVYDSDIAIHEEQIAWFQTSKRDNHLLTIYDGNTEFVWEPITHNPVFGCYCLLVEWYKEHVIFIYQEKHEIYICAVQDESVRYFKFHGEEIERKGNLIAYETYMGKMPGKVRMVQIPELTELEPIDHAEAEKLGLIPTGLNRFGDFLALKQ